MHWMVRLSREQREEEDWEEMHLMMVLLLMVPGMTVAAAVDWKRRKQRMTELCFSRQTRC